LWRLWVGTRTGFHQPLQRQRHPRPLTRRWPGSRASWSASTRSARKQAHLREAAAFADAEIAASRAVPAERAEIAAAYFQAAQDDAAAPAVVTFADGKTGTRVEGLQRLHAARPAHGYTQELVGDPSLVALFNRETTEEADPDAELVKSIGAFAERMNGASRKGGGT
jgi:hypothetical protein